MLAPPRLRACFAALLAGAVLGASQGVARGQDAGASFGSDGESPAKPRPKPIGNAERRELLRPPDAYASLFGTVAVGDGLRFNNPYRLHTELGSTARSVSLTAPYLDFGGAVTFGAPNGLQHGAAVHTGVSLHGVQQSYLSLSYVAAYRAGRPFLVYGRVGPSMLLSPDVNVGGEVAGSFSYFFTGALGLTSELAFDLFYGAATLDKSYTVYPILSGQLGLVVAYEVLP
jgi:hypothetical protein